jgi:Tol biopolymer transport system component
VRRIGSAIVCALAVAGTVGCRQILGLADPADAATSEAGDDAAADGPSGMGHDAGSDAASDAAPDVAPDMDSGGPPSGDADADAGPPCNLAQPFGAPTPVQGMDINTAANEGTPRLSPNQLTLYFWSDRAVGDAAAGITHVFVATRTRPTDPFSAPVPLTTLDTAVVDDDSPTVTEDGLTLVFGSDRETNANGPDQLFMAMRADAGQSFTSPSVLANVNLPAYDETTPYLRPDGQVLYFATNDPGGQGLHDIVRSARSGDFALPAFVPSINTASEEFNPCVSADETTVLWGSNRTDLDPHGDYDIYVALRPNVTQAFTSIANAGDAVNSAYLDLPGWISPDGCTLYMESSRGDGGSDRDLYVSRRLP